MRLISLFVEVFGSLSNAAIVNSVANSSYPLSSNRGVKANQRDAEKRRNRRRARRCVKR